MLRWSRRDVRGAENMKVTGLHSGIVDATKRKDGGERKRSGSGSEKNHENCFVKATNAVLDRRAFA